MPSYHINILQQLALNICAEKTNELDVTKSKLEVAEAAAKNLHEEMTCARNELAANRLKLVVSKF